MTIGVDVLSDALHDVFVEHAFTDEVTEHYICMMLHEPQPDWDMIQTLVNDQNLVYELQNVWHKYTSHNVTSFATFTTHKPNINTDHNPSLVQNDNSDKTNIPDAGNSKKSKIPPEEFKG
jgi:hypothetical protein